MAVTVMDLKAKRTKAVAPRSLFGTVVEIKNKKALAEMNQAEPVPKPTKLDKLAPFKDSNAGDILQAHEKQLKRQFHKAKHASGDLLETQHNAIHFNPDPATIKEQTPEGMHTFTRRRDYSPYQADVKHNSRDIALSEQFNRLGKNSERFYGPTKNTNYKHAGTILGNGGLFSDTDTTCTTTSNSTSKSKSFTAGITSVEISPRVCNSVFDIPANIRHIHGESLCNELLKNPKEFRRSIEERVSPKQQVAIPLSPANLELKTEPLYAALGNALRQDIFNGVSHSHIKSLNSSSYTDDIPANSTETYPPKFGVQRNADSKWNEDNVLRQRMNKQWDAMLSGGKKE